MTSAEAAEILLREATGWRYRRRILRNWARRNFCSPVVLFVPENTDAPELYGFAWREPWRRGTVAMPVPLNILGRWLRRGWHRLRMIPWGDRGTPIDMAYYSGRDAGRIIERRIQEAERNRLHIENSALRSHVRDLEDRLSRIQQWFDDEMEKLKQP